MSDAQKIRGSCMCGAVSYEISAAPARVAQCCCSDCQKASGTGHITLAFFPLDSVAISGEVAGHPVTADSGNINTRQFCPKCGSWVFSRNSARPTAIGVTAGTMDGNAEISPQAVVYADQQRAWDLLDAALPRFAKIPPPPK